MSIQAVNYGQDLSLNASQLNNAQSTQTGSLSGMSVQTAEDPLSAVQDSAEELTFARDNSRQTKLADRKQKSQAARQEELLKRVQQLQETVEHADNDAKKQALRRFKESGSRDPGRLLDDLKSLGGHASSDYAFLLNEAEHADADDAQLLKQAAEQLFAAKESDIRAVLNTLPAAQAAAGEAGLYISQTYSELASGKPEASDMLKFLETRFGLEQLAQGIDALFKALAADLHSAAPSRDTALLNDLASALGRTKTLNASLGLVRDFPRRLNTVLGFNAQKLQAENLLSDMLTLSKARFIAPLHVHNLYKNAVQTADPEQDVLAAQEFFNMLRKLPVELFDSAEGRLKLMDAGQKLIDELVDKEDAWLEGGA